MMNSLRKGSSFATLILIVVSLAVTVTVGFRVVSAQEAILYIKPDGTIFWQHPVDHYPQPPMKREGDLYTLTSSAGNIVIQRGNIVLNGDGYGVGGEPAINVSMVVNVTIQNVNFMLGGRIKVYFEDCSLSRVSNCSFISNPLFPNLGISIQGTCHDNIIENNSFYNNDNAIAIGGDCYNATIVGNSISYNNVAISLGPNCSNIRIVNNNLIAIEQLGVFLYENSSHCEVSGNRIECVGTGVYVADNCYDTIISGNILSEGEGISVALDCNGTYVVNNSLSAIRQWGISLLSSSHCQVSGNNLTGDGSGIHLMSSSYDSIFDNIFERCGIWNDDSYANNVFNNAVNGKPLVYLEGVSDRTIEDAGQVILISCDNVTVEDLDLSSSSLGVELWNTTNSRIANNEILGNSNVGIFLRYSTNNSIYHNNVINNVVPILSLNSNNSLDNGYPSGGNYWGGNYSGPDLKKGTVQNETGSDGIGDVSYLVDENNQDRYPLMNPWHEPPWTPYSSFDYHPLQPEINETVTFEAWNSYDFDGQIVNYFWDFGDGATSSETNAVASHSYIFPVDYNVTLRVSDNEGLNSTVMKSITVVKMSSNISLFTEQPTLVFGQNSTIRGSINPTRVQTDVMLWHRLGTAGNWAILANLTTNGNGNYSFNWSPHEFGTHQFKCNWTGDDYTFPSESQSLTVICTRIPTSISISTNCSSTLNGFKVEVKGTLTDIFASSLQNQTIVFQYTFAGIGTWIPITSDTTDNLGRYDIVWFPPATGYYLLKAEWLGDSQHFGTNGTIAVSTVPYEDEYVFSVESNSTIANLTFDSVGRRLSFTVSGENNTTGYSRVTIAKSLIADITRLKVHLNDVEYGYTTTETADSWILTLTYTHSTHYVTIDLASAMTTEGPFEIPWIYVIIATVAFVLILGLVLAKRKRKRGSTSMNH